VFFGSGGYAVAMAARDWHVAGGWAVFALIPDWCRRSKIFPLLQKSLTLALRDSIPRSAKMTGRFSAFSAACSSTKGSPWKRSRSVQSSSKRNSN
jgi:hypothetical protein